MTAVLFGFNFVLFTWYSIFSLRPELTLAGSTIFFIYKTNKMKVTLIAAVSLLTLGAGMHHFRYCPLQHLKSALAHHKTAAPAKDAKTVSTATLAMNK